MAVNTETWDQEAQWDVEKIVGHKDVDPVTGFPKMFKIKWLGWEDRFSSFEHLENLACTEVLAEYLKFHQVSADEAARLRSSTGQAPHKQVSAPRRRGRPPASKSAHTSDHTCALVNGKVECDYKVLFCTTDVRDDADGNMVVHHGSRGLLSPPTSKPVQSNICGRKKRTRAKRAATPKEDKLQKRKCVERKTRVDKADQERDSFNSMQKRVNPRGGNGSQQVDTFTRPSDSSNGGTDDDESVDLGIPEFRRALPVTATHTPAVSSQ
ncbi:hypothetical protein RvY_00395 [Ramazzottius varieornatus]|uniref:Chromo domain-containing protein n=1 Tax=Ramazzottius varieornatus TaxID=947166 RepID=A0A1D1UGQ5_RAMVA|nr:hypothetical protein RvY_00395 [Ramazzottius varieornatus]